MHEPCGFFSLPHHSAFDLPLGYPSCFFLLRFLSYHTLRISSVDSSKMVRIAFCMVFAMLALTLFKYKLDTFKSEYKSSMTLGQRMKVVARPSKFTSIGYDYGTTGTGFSGRIPEWKQNPLLPERECFFKILVPVKPERECYFEIPVPALLEPECHLKFRFKPEFNRIFSYAQLRFWLFPN